MQIKIKSLSLRNFKGIKKLDIQADGGNLNISGDNGTGKTTVMDAFLWLLFDKDSSNRSAFEVKTIDGQGEVIHGLEHEVEGVLLIDGVELKLKKLYQEKWTKQKGAAERVLTGHETSYWIDDAPAKKKEYTAKGDEIVPETTFKMLTSPRYFNEVVSWNNRREILMQVVGDVSYDEVFSKNNKLLELKKVMGNHSIEDYKKITQQRIRSLNDEIKQIPIRIDEINNNLPSLSADIEYDLLEKKREKLKAELKDIEEQQNDQAKIAQRYKEKQSELFKLKDELRGLEQKIKDEAYKEKRELERSKARLEDEVEELEQEIKTSKENIQTLSELIEINNKDRDKLREEWKKKNSQLFDIGSVALNCTLCGQALPEDNKEKKLEEMKKAFNSRKENETQEINKSGLQLKAKAEQHQKNLDKAIETLKTETDRKAEAEEDIKQIEEKLSSIKVTIDLNSNPQYTALVGKIEKLQAELENQGGTNDLSSSKESIQSEIDKINETLNAKDVIEKSKKRIEELMAQEKELSGQIHELEKHQYLIDEFTKTKVDLLESSINEKFKAVKFKLFKTLVNGGLEDCCETLINTNGSWVPYQDANNAGKINAGIDVINALSEFYGISAPIWVDNAEGVNELTETEAQVIRLVVSKYKNLRVEGC